MSLLAVYSPFDVSGNGLDDAVGRFEEILNATNTVSQLFERGLRLIDDESQAKIRRFYRHEDAWRTSAFLLA